MNPKSLKMQELPNKPNLCHRAEDSLAGVIPCALQHVVVLRRPGIHAAVQTGIRMGPGSLTFLAKSKIWRKVASGMTGVRSALSRRDKSPDGRVRYFTAPAVRP